MTNDKLAESIAFCINSYYDQDVLRTARDRLRDSGWIPIKDFLEDPAEGFCWIVYNKKVASAWFNLDRTVFKHSLLSCCCYPNEDITQVIPIKTPGLPK